METFLADEGRVLPAVDGRFYEGADYGLSPLNDYLGLMNEAR
jgi:hypothetical protein